MNKICNECSTENEKEYQFCKNCGNKLEETKKDENITTQNFSSNPQYTSPNDVGIQEISAEELSLFIGKKATNILPKFQKMELSNSKISWCWPVAILSFLFGPFGAALWFFYRKMYKNALIFSGIGAAVSIIVSLLTFSENNAMFDNVIESILNGNFESAITTFQSLDTFETVFSILATALQNLIEIATTIFTGIFSYHIYKNHCLEKIRAYKNSQTDFRFYKIGISAIGGVSSGMLALGILIMLGTDYLISLVSTLFSIFF